MNIRKLVIWAAMMMAVFCLPMISFSASEQSLNEATFVVA